MDLKNSRLFRRVVQVFLYLNLLVCPFIFIGMMFAPSWIAFLEPVVCPEGMQLVTVTEQQEDMEGDLVNNVTTHCADGRDRVDVTWKVMGIMVGFPILGVLVFLIAPMKPKEDERPMIDPEGFK